MHMARGLSYRDVRRAKQRRQFVVRLISWTLVLIVVRHRSYQYNVNCLVQLHTEAVRIGADVRSIGDQAFRLVVQILTARNQIRP